MKRTAFAALAAFLLSASAMAASGSYVDEIKGGGATNPKCVLFYTVDGDTTAYGISTRDTNYVNNLLAIYDNKTKHVLNIAGTITFAGGTPSSGVGVDFFPGDCTNGSPAPVYVWGIMQ